MTFEDLSLHPKILSALKKAGYTEPTEIQLKAIPKILEGSDLKGSAQTGTGKTAAFLLPALNRLVEPSEKGNKGPRLVILVPTRELAMQITTQAEKYSKHLNRIKTVCVFGGASFSMQQRQLSKPYDILIATPGRLIDFIERRKITFPRLEMLVLDEADRMLDMGFIDQVKDIVAAMPSERQTLLFSATLEGNISKLSKQLLNDPQEVVVHSKEEKHENIEQTLHYVDNLSHKNRLLDHILNGDGVEQSLIFTSTKRHADQLVDELHDKGYQVGALHGDMNQRQRTRTIMRLRDGKIKTLVATDVAARGIDVQSITHVINFDLPRNVEDYVHRIGRTGRAGAKGTALSFAAGQDRSLVRRIEQFTGQSIDIKEIAGLEPSPMERRSPKKRTRGGGKRQYKGSSNSSNGRGRSREDSPRKYGRSGDKPSGKFGRSREDSPRKYGRSGDKPSGKFGRSREDSPKRYSDSGKDSSKRFGRSGETSPRKYGSSREDSPKRYSDSGDRPSRGRKSGAKSSKRFGGSRDDSPKRFGDSGDRPSRGRKSGAKSSKGFGRPGAKPSKGFGGARKSSSGSSRQRRK